MIAVLLGLLLIAGVINIFLGTQQTNRTQEALARVQETGRFAVEILSRQAREAGMNGCPAGSVNNLLDPSGTGYDAASMAGSEPFSFIDPDDLDGHVRGHVLTINGARRLDLNLEASGNGSAGGGGRVPPINLTSTTVFPRERSLRLWVPMATLAIFSRQDLHRMLTTYSVQPMTTLAT